MAKSTKSARRSKPAKPYKDFPLFAHATGRWAKKIRGKMHYFGPWDDPDAALERYQEQRDDLYAGRAPRTKRGGLTVARLADEFLNSKRRLLDSGEIRERTFRDYYRVCDRIVSAFGKNRSVEDLRPADFERLRASIAKTYGPVALGNEIQRIRVVFNFAFQMDLIDRPVRYGPNFKRPPKKVLRKEKAKNGKRLFDAGELRVLLQGAGQPMRSMILLAINCGLGNTDVSELPLSAVDLDGGWIDYPLPKTGIERRCPLWPETVAALREALEQRPKPRAEGDADLCFLTKYGRRWTRTSAKQYPIDPVGMLFNRLQGELGIKTHGRGFYAVRHTFRTVADESKDQPAVDHIMGHDPGDMASVYRERIADERLQSVTETVRQWLRPWACAGGPRVSESTPLKIHHPT